jgi:uncharacterized protein (TIGR03382 family)
LIATVPESGPGIIVFGLVLAGVGLARRHLVPTVA